MPNAPAEKAGLKVGDKILEINGTSVINERHDIAVQCIQKSIENLELVISRNEDSIESKKCVNIVLKVKYLFNIIKFFFSEKVIMI